jgi:hypothetical protein
MSNPSSLDELLQAHGGQFVEHAYHVLLNRAPDPSGFDFYGKRLAMGVAKIQIIAEISRSSEARVRRNRVPGLRRAIFLHRLACIPLLGRVVRILANVDGPSFLENRIRVIEQQMFVLATQSSIRGVSRTVTFGNEATIAPNSSDDQISNGPQTSIDADLSKRPATADVVRNTHSVLIAPIIFSKGSAQDVINQLAEIVGQSREASEIAGRG